ncbi:MAG: cache domain-containing protein [Paracoccaceae bacterium]
MPLPTLKLKHKLPLTIVGLSLAVGVGLELVSAYEFRIAAEDAAEAHLGDLAESRATAITQWYHKNASVLNSLSITPDAPEAITELRAGLRELADGPGALYKAYVTDNPNPAGARQALDRAPGLEGYHAQHAWVNRWLRETLEVNDLYDIFLIDPAGTVLYSVAKEADFMSNLVSGPYANSGLAQVFDKVMKGTDPDATYMSDLAPYAASAGLPATFMGTNVVDTEGRTIGVLAFQMPHEILWDITNAEHGLGTTGEAYLLGADGKTRNPSRLEGEFDAFAAGPQSAQSLAAREGQEGYFADTVNWAGHAAVAEVVSYSPTLGQISG